MAARSRRRSLAIRHVSGHQLIALIEVVSPAKKDRPKQIEEFTEKILSALEAGVHVLILDLFPPGRDDPDGLPGVLRRQLENSDEPYDLPDKEPLTLASYAAGSAGRIVPRACRRWGPLAGDAAVLEAGSLC